MVTEVKNSKKGFFKYVNNTRKTRESQTCC